MFSSIRGRGPSGPGCHPVAAIALAALLGVAACGDAPAPPPAGGAALVVTDDVGRTVALQKPAVRIVSLLPAATQTLVDLGALGHLVGRTRYDDDPRLAHLTSVGGGLDPNLETIVSLRPDLVVAWESPTGSRVRERLESMGIPVFAAATRDTTAILRTIEGLGVLTGRAAFADTLARRIHAQLDSVRGRVPAGPRPSVLYVIALDPPIISGTENFIAEIISVAGGEPVAISSDRRGVSPQVSLEELVRRQPDLIILPVGADAAMSLERIRREPGWRDLRAVREGRVAAVDVDRIVPGAGIGEMAELFRATIEAHAPRR